MVEKQIPYQTLLRCQKFSPNKKPLHSPISQQCHERPGHHGQKVRIFRLTDSNLKQLKEGLKSSGTSFQNVESS